MSKPTERAMRAAEALDAVDLDAYDCLGLQEQFGDDYGDSLTSEGFYELMEEIERRYSLEEQSRAAYLAGGHPDA